MVIKINIKYDKVINVVLVMKGLWVYWLKMLNFLIGLWKNREEMVWLNF